MRKGRPVNLTLPPVQDAAGIVTALGAVVDAVPAGELTPDEAGTLANVLEVKRRSIETSDLAARVESLEKKAGRT